MFTAELVILILVLLLGARFGGLFFGMAGALGLLVLTVFFQTAPTSPPINVLLIITSVVLAASTMQQCGGMNILVRFAERVLKKHPNQIVFLAPLIAWVFTFMAGTGNVLFNILPVIAAVSRKAGIRPERPISVAVIASQHAVVASPISAATVALAAILAPFEITLMDILMLAIPSTLVGIMAGAVSVLHKGKDLADDEAYQKLIHSKEFQESEAKASASFEENSRSKWSVIIFLAAAVLVILMGTFSALRPEVVNGAGKVLRVSMTNMIEIIMMSAAGLMVMVCRPNVDKIPDTGVFKAGMMGVVTIFGLAWMADSFVAQNITVIKQMTTAFASSGPIYFAIALFVASIFLDSQGATVAALMPLGIAIGIEPILLAAIFPAVCGYYFIPNNGVMVAGVAFDTAKTTKIGKMAVNHSYMLPGTVATIVATVTGVILAEVFF